MNLDQRNTAAKIMSAEDFLAQVRALRPPPTPAEREAIQLLLSETRLRLLCAKDLFVDSQELRNAHLAKLKASRG